MDQLTPEEQKLQAEAAHHGALLTQVITAPTQAEREAAARELGILSPANESHQSRVVINVLRTPDNRWWGCFMGTNGPISQAIHDTPEEMVQTLSAAAQLAVNVLMTDAEHAAYAAKLRGDGA